MKVYIAGPMRGKPAFNFPAFDEASEWLRAQGHEVFSPADHDRESGFDPSSMAGDENLAALGFDLRAALAADLAWITTEADAVYLLPGWETSSGARAELAAAAALGLLAATGDAEWAPATEYMAELTGVHAPASGEIRVTSTTGGQKGTKPARFDLIPTGPLWALAELYGRGAEKYAPRNYERGYDWSLSFAAMQRHAWSFWSGQDVDDETGLPHLASVAWHAFALMLFGTTHPEFDDRPGGGAS